MIPTTKRAAAAEKLALELFAAVAGGSRAVALKVKRARLLGRRRRAGFTLRPGTGTPLWNELVQQTKPGLRRWGSKARLARFLRLPRQRLQDCLKARTATLDAERTLLLLGWVAARRQGRDLNL